MADFPLLRVDRVSKRFGAVQALSEVSLDVRGGEVIALLGDNGAGKSTLIKVIAGNIAPDEGDILVDGASVLPLSPARSRSLGIETVYQDLSLCPNLGVVANFFMGRERVRRRFGLPMLDEQAMATETVEALERIGAKLPSVDAHVGQLSGGQRQAIELARFVHWGGRLVILDEPFAALSVEQTRRGLDLIQRVRERGIAVIVITHNMAHAFRGTDRVVVLRQGRVVSDKPTAETNADEAVSAITGD
ncbi:MAG: ATP-binding cassette domain-containing protein [Rhodothermales bacterium]